MTRAEEFEQLRPLLFAIAYRILARRPTDSPEEPTALADLYKQLNGKRQGRELMRRE